jgi:tartrate dehydrogenase/decarboxylase / D-malate dehydrogenase
VAKTYRIALYPGDGIGIDVTDEVVRVLGKVQELQGDFSLEMERFDWGAEYFASHGVVAPEDYLETLRPFDAIFLGALGWPGTIPDHITLEPLIGIRQSFDQYACVRPAKRRPGVPSPLAASSPVDMVVVRENSEGEYVPCGGRVRRGDSREVAVQSAVHTRKGVERILRFGADLARKRRKRLTMITKSNAQRYAYVLWDEVLEQLAPEFADLEVDKQHVDAASMNFVLHPDRFDVVVASNLFGDILSDLSGAIAGSLGLNPSANLNPEREFPSMFEPVHGSAPDIAGKGIANPVAAVIAGAMMLDWLGLPAASAMVEKAVEGVLVAGETTPDLGGTLNTTQMTDRIIERLEE